MRNTPILIPIILVVCLGTLAYLLYAALTTAPSGPGYATTAMVADRAVAQNQLRTAPPPATGNSTEAEASEPDLDTYFQRVPESQVVTADGTDATNFMDADEDVELSGMDNDVTREVLADRAGAYTVQAGSFRQLLNAENQVKKLKKAGFGESIVQKSTGGAYAMAVVGRRATEADANELVAQLKRKGFDARVVKR
ncbi:SPOR domain-containing protein [Lewinella sp. 4G2]|uniref:SPOR domain-containing protein n=1 Tax=Lewinella sp. 4G2 TaxID=1803372 RepID=UPI0007B4717E|nr:SPOR domain-containing protein [Lewinella sp. 4G2]OAV43362.1 hypothetical protein A3850_002110 [Lewinella sp. 4G2]